MHIAIFNIPTSGHVNPTLPLTAELIRRGHRVTYYLTPGYAEKVSATGAEFRAYAAIDDNYFDEVSRRFNPGRLATQLVETAHDLLPELARQVREQSVDVILYDSMCPWGHLIAKATNRLAVASMSLIDLPPSYMLKAGQLTTVAALTARMLPWLLRFQAARRRLRQAYGLRTPGFPAILNWPGDQTIIYTVPELLPGKRSPDPNLHFVGPPIAARPDAPPFPFEQLNAQKPLIYISLGTVFNANVPFFQACLKAFGGEELQVVMSAGKHVRATDLGELPPNVLVRPYLPQLALLERADLFITHSGVNSVHEGLYFGVPLLLAPQQLEQAMVAARVAELGAGLVLKQPADPVDMRRQARRLLTELEFKETALQLGQALQSRGGVYAAAAAVERAALSRRQEV